MTLQMVEAGQNAQQGRTQPTHRLEKKSIALGAWGILHPANLPQTPARDGLAAWPELSCGGMLLAQSPNPGFKSTGATRAERTRKESR